MPDKRQILSSVIALAKQLGRAPTRSEFLSYSGISVHIVMRWFRTWNDAVRAARLRPHEPRLKLKDRELGRAINGSERVKTLALSMKPTKSQVTSIYQGEPI